MGAPSLQVGGTDLWMRFVAAMEDRVDTASPAVHANDVDTALDREIDAELVRFGAWPDRDQWPLLLRFPDEGSFVAFMMRWG